MAEKTINRAVRVNSVRYTTGEEEELDRALTPDQARALKDASIIEGDFKGRKSSEKASDDSPRGRDKDPTLQASRKQRRRRKNLRKASSRRKKKARKSSEVDSDLPEDFPGRSDLARAGLTSEDAVTEKDEEDGLESVDGIGTATAERIRDYLGIEEEVEEEEEEVEEEEEEEVEE